MEEEAIHKYKEKNYKHNLVVEDYGVLHHLEKSWLSANNNRNDISEDENEEFTDSSTDIVGEKNFSDSDENEDAPPTLQYSQGYESGCL
ncbi:uncharacterized protein [Eleutherodactylus coqui]|uniref:uncharacterized protein isoform X2 n=1 Tax=Eleutherodactylus coqui TaxID=57060 RepID=UPI003461DC01